MRDPEFGPVRVRAFGTYTIRVTDPGKFVKEIVGTDGRFTTGEVSDQIRNILVARFSDALAGSGIAVLDMAANLDELGGTLLGRVTGDIGGYGLELRTLLVENVSLPPAVEEALDKRTSMGVIGDLSKYTQFQAATAIGDAAKNPGGGGAAAAGIGAGLGLAMAGQMGQALGGQGRAGGPPPIPQALFFAAVDGQQAGPFDVAALKDQIRAGKVKKDTLVWAEGMADWTAAEKVDAVSKLFGAVPPPLPK
jgi:membrane protease subunit (stomatin/prohibitin family)